MQGYYTHIESQEVYAVLGVANYRRLARVQHLDDYPLVVYMKDGLMFCKDVADFEMKFVKNL